MESTHPGEGPQGEPALPAPGSQPPISEQRDVNGCCVSGPAAGSRLARPWETKGNERSLLERRVRHQSQGGPDHTLLNVEDRSGASSRERASVLYNGGDSPVFRGLVFVGLLSTEVTCVPKINAAGK